MSRFLFACSLLCVSAFVRGAECGDVALERARFASAVEDREPLGMPSPANEELQALWFFTEIRGGKGRTLHHQWFWQDSLVADIPLDIGGNRWRTWSSKILGARRGDSWRVDLRLDDGCLLGSHTLGDADAVIRAEGDSPPVSAAASDEPAIGLERGTADVAIVADIRRLLAEGDITGARLALANNGGEISGEQRERLTLEVSLARIAAQVESDELYLAAARLEQLRAQSLPADLYERVAVLDRKLSERRNLIDREMARALIVWERVQAETLTASDCAEDEPSLRQALLTVPGGEHLMVNAPQRQGDNVIADVLDSRTGLMHRITQRCVRWPWQ